MVWFVRDNGKGNGVNIKKHSDRLDNLLARCEREIRETEKKLRVLKAGRPNLDLMSQEPEKPATPLPEPAEVHEAGITKSVLEAVSDLCRIRKNVMTLTED